MRELVSYSEAFKLRLVEDVASGKYASLLNQHDNVLLLTI
jgi:transposase-like protein